MTEDGDGFSVARKMADSLRDNALQVEFADLLEELTAMRFDVIEVALGHYVLKNVKLNGIP